jgi:vacuolar protein sorting-associated protein 35
MQEFDEESQEMFLEAHTEVVRQQALQMKKSLDGGNLRETLKYSSTMLAEMKTSSLSPRNYFKLCKPH